MLSIEFSNKIELYRNKDYIKIESLSGKFIKKLGKYTFNIVNVSDITRVYVGGGTVEELSILLTKLSRITVGLLRGFKLRLRLVGIGFRSYIQEINVMNLNKNNSLLYIKKYRINRVKDYKTANKSKILVLKIGYSHERGYPIIKQTNVIREPSRLDSRTKSTLIVLKSIDKLALYQIGSEIRKLRIPNIYIGKGIKYYDEKTILKKGKRQS